MTITKLFPSGDLLISEIYKGQLEQRRYQGYTKKEAVKLFNQDKKESRVWRD